MEWEVLKQEPESCSFVSMCCVGIGRGRQSWSSGFLLLACVSLASA